jgi:hypothetical protein
MVKDDACSGCYMSAQTAKWVEELTEMRAEASLGEIAGLVRAFYTWAISRNAALIKSVQVGAVILRDAQRTSAVVRRYRHQSYSGPCLPLFERQTPWHEECHEFRPDLTLAIRTTSQGMVLITKAWSWRVD